MNTIKRFKLPDGRKARIVQLHSYYYVIQAAQPSGKSYRTLRDQGDFCLLETVIRAAKYLEDDGLQIA